MPFCPECRFEYLPETEKCPDCDANLVPVLADEPKTQEMVPCWRTDNYIEADSICSFLREKNITCNIVTLGGLADGAYPTPAVNPSSHTLLVSEDMAEKARKIIEEEYLQSESAE